MTIHEQTTQPTREERASRYLGDLAARVANTRPADAETAQVRADVTALLAQARLRADARQHEIPSEGNQ